MASLRDSDFGLTSRVQAEAGRSHDSPRQHIKILVDANEMTLMQWWRCMYIAFSAANEMTASYATGHRSRLLEKKALGCS